MITPDTVLTFEIVANVQSVADGTVILLTDSGQLFTGNGTTDTIIRHIDGRRTIAELAAVLEDEFDVSRNTAVADVIEITEMLVAEGIVRPFEPDMPQNANDTR